MERNNEDQTPRLALPSVDMSDPKDVSLWLINGFSCYEFGDQAVGAAPFDGFQQYIKADEQLIESLTNGFQRLSITDQQLFSDGLKRAIQRSKLSDDRTSLIAERLLSLAISVGAQDAIVTFAGKIDLNSESKTTRRLLRLLIEGLAVWPLVEDRDTAKIVSRLARAAVFSPIEARRALLVLCKATPTDLVKHLALLHPHLQDRYGPDAVQRNGAKRRAERNKRVMEVLNQIVDPKTLDESTEAWPRRALAEDGTSEMADWWIYSLSDPEILKEVQRIKGPQASEARRPRSQRLLRKKSGMYSKLKKKRKGRGITIVSVDPRDREIAEERFIDADELESV